MHHPPYPGITSAVGLLTTDVKYDATRTAFQVSTAFDLPRLNAAFTQMQNELHQQFSDDGIAQTAVTFTRFADVRYVGQGYELRVAVSEGSLDAAALDRITDRFHRQHELEYGHFFVDSPIEIVTVRLVGVGQAQRIHAASSSGSGSRQGRAGQNPAVGVSGSE